MNSDDTQAEDPSVADAIATLMSELPKPVQDFITGPDRARIALALTQKYRLHADQAGEFETAYIHMLLGISSPEEFVDTLTRAGISSEDVRGLVTDVNEQVFMPLRRAEQGSTSTPAPQPAPRAAMPAQILPGSSEPVPSPTPARTAEAPVQTPPQAGAPYMYPVPQMPMQPMMYAPAPYGMPMPYPAPVYLWPQPPVAPWGSVPVPQPQYPQAPMQYAPAPAPVPAVPVAPTYSPAPHAHTTPEHHVLAFGYQPPAAPLPTAPHTAPSGTTTPPARTSSDPYREPFA
jgi:hypothetical protein